MDVQVKRIDPELPVPTFANKGDAGADLYAAVGVTVGQFSTALIPIGFAVAIPAGHVGFICPRSGLSKHNVTVANAPGVVDSGYRGELMVRLANHSEQPYTIRRGDRIAQLVILPIDTPRFRVVDSLDDTERGTNGFGSTGR